MKQQDAKKKQIAKQLGVSVQVLEQYFQLKRAEVTYGDPEAGGSVGYNPEVPAKDRSARS